MASPRVVRHPSTKDPTMVDPTPSPSSSSPAGQPAPGPSNSSSKAIIVRESDRLRTGLAAEVLDVSTAVLSLGTRDSFALNEAIKIRLRNVVQRFEKETRGAVQRIESGEDGSTTIHVELMTRLTPLEVSLLKMGIASPESRSGPKWV